MVEEQKAKDDITIFDAIGVKKDELISQVEILHKVLTISGAMETVLTCAKDSHIEITHDVKKALLLGFIVGGITTKLSSK